MLRKSALVALLSWVPCACETANNVAVGNDGLVLTGSIAARDFSVGPAQFPLNVDLRSVLRVDNEAWAAGTPGAIYFSDDSGKSWVPDKTNPAHIQTPELNDLAADTTPNLFRMWAVGDGGVIMRRGYLERWGHLKSGVTADLYGVAAVRHVEQIFDERGFQIGSKEPQTVVVAVGANGVIRRSTDGGNTWTTPVFTGAPPGETTLYDVELDAAHSYYGIIVGADGFIAVTGDAGASWTRVTELNEGDKPDIGDLHGVAIAIAGYGTVYICGDRGVVMLGNYRDIYWHDYVPQASPGPEDLLDIHVEKIAHVAVVGKNGTLAVSNDLAQSWQRITDPKLNASVTLHAIN